jgi:hypothetical protein
MARRMSCFFRYLILPGVAALITAGLAGCGGSAAVAVTIVKPATVTVDPGNSITLTANVAHDSSGVSWSMTGTGCSGSACGSLSGNTATSVTYTAPATVTTAFSVAITATSKKDTAKTSSISLSIPVNPAIATAIGALTAGQVGSTYSVTLTSAGGIPPYSWSVTQGTLPAGLTLASSAGTISGIPTASGPSSFTIQVKDSGSPALTASGQFSIAISPAPAIVFSTASLASATYNVAYTASVAATGGAGALTYQVTTGKLPTGLAMSSGGAISGTPTAAGTANFTVTASDAYGDSAQQNLSIAVNYPAIVISPASGALQGGQYKVAYSQNLAATGGSGSGYVWSVTAGASSLSAVNLSVSSSGAVTGTPQAVGNASFTVQVKDSYGDTQTASYTIAVTYPALTVTTPAALASGMVGISYAPVTLSATGGSGTGYSWSVTSGAALSAAGLALSSGGVISGTPGAAESAATVTIQVQDSANNKASATFALTIYPALNITNTSVPNATYGVAYTTSLAATGGDGSGLTWSTASAPALTSVGLSLSSAGVLSGTPPSPPTAPAPNCQSGKAYCLTLSVSVANSDNAAFATTASVALTLVYPALTVATTTLPSGVDGTLYSQQLAASGGSGTGYTWSTTGTNNLTAFNLTLSSAGLLSGTPPASTTGTATFTAQVQDSIGDTATASLSVAINGSLSITTATLPAAIDGVAYSQQLGANGGSGGNTWSTTGSSNLASFNLTLSPTGLLAGTPSTAGTASFTAQVKDSSGATATQPYTFQVYGPLSLPAPDPVTLPSNGFTGIGYTGSINASGGSGSYSWSVSGLSDGLSVFGGTTGSTLTIAGTPTAPASGTSPVTVTFNVTLTDTVTKAAITQNGYNITISYPTPPTLPVGTSTVPGSATVNQSFVASIGATGGVGPTYTWTLNGATTIPTSSSVPLGSATLNSQFTITNPGGGNSISISGSPTSTGQVSFSLAVKDNTTGLASSTQNYTINVIPVSTVAITANVPQGMANMPYTFADLSINGGVPPYNVTYSNLPAWLSQQPGTWNLAGTPTASGSSTITVNVTDSSTPTPQQQTATFTVTVVPETVATNNGELKGQYACFYQQYWPIGVNPGTGQTLYRGGFVLAFAANGGGSITGGEVDSNSPSKGYKSATTNGAVGGTYAVGSDNRGYLMITAGGQPGPILALAGGDINAAGQFTQFDLTGMDDVGVSPSGKTGAGRCYQQNTSPALNTVTLSGGHVYLLTGEDMNGALESVVGSLQYASGGSSFSYVQDAVDAGSYSADMTGSGTTTAVPDAYGRSTFTAGPSGQTASPTVMYITNDSAGDVVIMSAQSHNSSSNADFLVGQGRTQNAAHIAASSPLSGPAVLYSSGQDSDLASYKAQIAQISSSGVQVLVNKAGTLTAQSMSSLAFNVDPTSGRTTITGQPGIVFYLYDTNAAAVLFGDTGSSGTASENQIGWIEPQTVPTSGKWSVADFATSYFMNSPPNGDSSKDFSSFVFTLDSTGAFTYFAQDDGGQEWADWDENICGSGCGTTATGTLIPDTTYDPNGTLGIFDVKITVGTKTETTVYCMAASYSSSTTKARVVCLDATSGSPQLSIGQQ